MKASHCQSRPHSHTYAEWFESSVTSFDVQDAEERPFKMRLRHPPSLLLSFCGKIAIWGPIPTTSTLGIKIDGFGSAAKET